MFCQGETTSKSRVRLFVRTNVTGMDYIAGNCFENLEAHHKAEKL